MNPNFRKLYAILAIALTSALLGAHPAWATFVVETAELTGLTPSLALDAQDRPHVAFSDFGASVGYSRRSGGAWSKETVSLLGPGYVALALDAQDNPRIAFTDGAQALHYAAKSGGAWTIEQVDVAIARWTSIAIDAQGNPHVSYFWFGGAGSAELRRARKAGGSWVINTVDTSPFGISYTSIAIDSQDRPHIAYLNESAGTDFARHAYRTASAWVVENADQGAVNSVSWTSIAIDPQDDVHMSYNADSRVSYALKAGGIWVAESISIGTSPGTSIALDAQDDPHITFAALGDLYYARKTGGVWTTEVADPSAGGGSGSSLAIGTDDIPRATYENQSTDAVLYGLRDPATGVVREEGAGASGVRLSVRPSVLASGSATILFDVPATGGALDLAVFDIAGRRVATLATGRQVAGTGHALWDGRNGDGFAVASGTYFLRLVAERGASATQRVVLLR